MFAVPPSSDFDAEGQHAEGQHAMCQPLVVAEQLVEILIILAVGGCASGVRSWIFQGAAERVMAQLRGDLFRHLMTQGAPASHTHPLPPLHLHSVSFFTSDLSAFLDCCKHVELHADPV